MEAGITTGGDNSYNDTDKWIYKGHRWNGDKPSKSKMVKEIKDRQDSRFSLLGI